MPFTIISSTYAYNGTRIVGFIFHAEKLTL